MARFEAAELADQAVPQEIQIPDGIENLVLHEFIFVTQAVLIEHSIVIENDGVVHVAAERQIARPQAF